MTRRRGSRSRQLALDLDRPVMIERGRRSTWLRGVTRDLLDNAGVPRMWDHEARCWMIPAQFTDIVVNVAKIYGREITVTAVDR